ncbi:YutD family protein [Cohnella sp. AR92]|uniref:YutD family protein n=1 Tax=Cohnella sp. AR92 TaxID=648716 RepID=UPI000F8F6F90|nr:YutD family protein [Cohnella sp. AR92]RUS46166.1 DUF1027 domain-containing protein [Cohnella sp. AR92]
MAGGIAYTLVHDYKNGWNPEAFRERFSEVLERYDYVVGDWGYNQLRLKGFFREAQPKASRDAVINGLIDYINEYCNFGCAYFVLEKLDPSAIPEDAVIFSSPAAAEPASADTPAEEGSEAPAADPAAAATNAAAAANSSAPLLRWPLKERPGGRVPGTSPSAVARAVSEGAERRAAAAAQANGGSRSDSPFGRGYPDGGGSRSKGGSDSSGRERRNNGNQGHHNSHGGSRQGHGNSSSGGGSERRHNGQDRKGGGGGHPRGSSNQHAGNSSAKDHHDRSGGTGGDARASIAAGAEGDQPSRQSGGGGRWAGKNRRRGGFHGKPNRPRPDGAPRAGGGNGPRSEAGNTGGER